MGKEKPVWLPGLQDTHLCPFCFCPIGRAGSRSEMECLLSERYQPAAGTERETSVPHFHPKLAPSP